jgi:hypothetical protein
MAESPAGLDQPLPRRGVDPARDRQSARALKGLDEGDRPVAKVLDLVVGREVSE